MAFKIAHKVSPNEQERVVVVGGGLAGLAAATYLARGGLDVSLLEKAPTVGGRATTDAPNGYYLNRGIHALYTGGPASAVLRELGVQYTSGSPRHVFALDADGLHPFPATPMEMLRTDLLSGADKAELMALFVRLGLLNPASLANVSIADWIASATQRPKLRQLLTSLASVYVYSSAIDLASADTFVAKLQQSIKHPIHYIDGGWQSLVDGLVKAAVAAGVRIRASASVAEVQLRDGRAQSVRLHDGTDLECTQLLLAILPDDAARLIGGKFQQLQPVHVACLDLGLSELRRREHPVVFDLEQPRFMTVQSEFARVAPAGGAVIHAFKQLDPRVPNDPHADRAELEAFMDVLQPGWRAVVTERRFLPHILAAGSLPLASTGGLTGRTKHRSVDIQNIYFAGDWVGPRGFLIDASLDSARESARLILQQTAVDAARAA